MYTIDFIEAAGGAGLRDYIPKTAVCRDVVEAFRYTVIQTKAVLAAPGFSFAAGGSWFTACRMARDEIVGPDASDEETQRRSEEIGKRAERYMEKNMRMDLEAQRKLLEISTREIETHAANAGEAVHGTLVTILKTVIILGWGAIEVLAEELLSQSFKHHPIAFKGMANPKFGCSSFWRIEQRYSDLFNHDNEFILATARDPSLAAVCILRNALAHNLGHADQAFITESLKNPLLADFHGILDNQSLLIKGGHIRDIVNPSFDATLRLVNAVDDWLIKFG
jgi:hypothetical protein